MYLKSIDIWEKINDITLVRYRCFQTIPENKYYIQSKDYYYWDVEKHCVDKRDFDTIENNFFDILLEGLPSEEFLFDSLEEALKYFKSEEF